MLSPEALDQSMMKLKWLLGNWEGQGVGQFPTIDPFHYSEALVIRLRGDESYLLYEQSATIIDEEGKVLRLGHWEYGIIRPMEDGTIEVSNCQNSGRVEVLTGELSTAEPDEASLTLNLYSKHLGNDPHMRSSSRTISLAGNHLTYEMSMSTSKVDELTFHLRSELTRNS